MDEYMKDWYFTDNFKEFTLWFNKTVKPIVVKLWPGMQDDQVGIHEGHLFADQTIVNKFHGYSIPAEITDEVYENLKYVQHIHFYIRKTPNKAALKLRSGWFFNELRNYFKDVVDQKEKKLKFILMAGHDDNIAAFTYSMEIYKNFLDYKQPHYASTLIFELWQKTSEEKETSIIDYYVKAIYNDEKIHIKGCDYECPFKKFLKIMKDLAVPDAEEQCNNVIFKARK